MAKVKDEDIIWDETPQVSDEDIVWDDKPKKEIGFLDLPDILGAPVRTGLKELIETGGDTEKALQAAKGQFGNAPKVSGKQLVQAAGVPEYILAPKNKAEKNPKTGLPISEEAQKGFPLAAALGIPAEIVADPSTYLGAPIAKGALALTQVAGKITAPIGRGLSKLANIAGSKAIGQPKAVIEDYGTELVEKALERDLIPFLGSAENIADRAADLKKTGIKETTKVLSPLSSEGAIVPKENLLADFNNVIKSLENDPSQIAVKRELERFRDVIKQSPDILDAEQTKRSFQMAADFGPDTTPGAREIASDIYKRNVEEQVQSLAPEALQPFLKGKETTGIGQSIEQLAKSTAAGQLAQKPGNLKQVVAADAAGIGGLGIQKLVEQRLPSAIAKTSYELSKIPKSLEGFKGFSPMLKQRYPEAGPIIDSILRMPPAAATRAISQLSQQFPEEFEQTEYVSEVDGKIFSPEDKQAYKQDLDDNLPPRERAKAMAALNKDGSITWRKEQAPVTAPVEEAPAQPALDLRGMAERANKKRPY